jgi:murein DD-endopeptidase MepM/ murein hydrolase activator NlpD
MMHTPMSDRFGRNLLLALLLATFGLHGLSASESLPPRDAIHGSASEVAPEKSSVRVTTRREDAETHFYVENKEYCEITMTFEMNISNLKADVAFPYTMTFPPRQSTEAFTLSPEDADRNWEYSFTNYYKLGSNCARPNNAVTYQLPYAPGEKFKVTQGYNGKFSHTGSNQYAIDWQMPEGTFVRAAREGVVVRAKDDSDRGGPSMDYDRYNNYVLIRHDDGTLAHYCHLQKGGCLVKAGQRVAVGDIIARSGNTGFSSGPHLHLCVFMTRNGRERLSLPVKFRTTAESAITLASGHSYRAAAIPNVQRASGPANLAAQAAGQTVQ